jgi:hypothetical protein
MMKAEGGIQARYLYSSSQSAESTRRDDTGPALFELEQHSLSAFLFRKACSYDALVDSCRSKGGTAFISEKGFRHGRTLLEFGRGRADMAHVVRVLADRIEVKGC